MDKFLKVLWVIQEKKCFTRLSSYTKRRINPLNPLSYITLLTVFIVGILMFGLYGFWKEADLSNPFKWK